MRTLVLNIGNSSLLVGVFTDDRLVTQFRVPVKAAATPRSWKKFLGNRLRGKFDRAALCSVVPALTPKIMRQVEAKLGVAPLLLTAAAAHGLKIGYRDPRQLGTDRLAAALGARLLFPEQNVVIVDCGTATTVTALNKKGVLLGGAIFPGLGLWSEMLVSRTAQLPPAEVVRPVEALGRSTAEGLQSGIFYGHVGAVRELTQRIRKEAFGQAPAVVVGTGGSAEWLTLENLFTVHEPGLILTGLHFFAHFSSDHA